MNRKAEMFLIVFVSLLLLTSSAVAKDKDIEAADARLKEKLRLPTIVSLDRTEPAFIRALKEKFIDIEVHRVKASPVPRTVYSNTDATVDIIGDPEVKEIGFNGRVENARAKDHEGAVMMLSAALGAFCGAGPEDISRALGAYSSLYIDKESKKRARLTSGRCLITFEPPAFMGGRCTIVRGR